MLRVIAIAGLAGAGKSTIASILSAQYGFQLLKFADPLKQMMAVMGLSREDMEDPRKKGLPYKLLCNKSPRYAMQTLGTEWGRVLIGENLWSGIWRQRAKNLLLDGQNIICDDCRFVNEVEVVKDLGGEIWSIRRPLAPAAIAHASETGVAMQHADWRINNSGTVADLHQLITNRMSGEGSKMVASK